MNKKIENVWVSGFVAGDIGYLAVAVMFAVFNILAGRSPFYTAALLGSSLFYGLTDATMLEVTHQRLLVDRAPAVGRLRHGTC